LTDVVATTQAFWLYAPQLPFVAADQLLIYAFYARHDTRTPTAVAFVTALIWATVALLGLRLFDWRALVLANTIQNCAHAVILYALFRGREPAIAAEGVIGSWSRGVAASALMAVVCLALALALGHALRPGKGADLLQLLVAGGAGTMVYAAALLRWHGEETSLLRRTLRRQAA
jgi:putative peptidoglycan lipid II flippase